MTTTDSAPTITAPKVSADTAFESPTEAISIVKPRAWLALVACLILVVSVVAWSMIVQIPISVTTPSAVLVNGSLVPVTSPTQGRLAGYEVEVEQEVKRGQPIAKILEDSGKVVTVPAPTDGGVSSLFGTPGSLVQAGSPIANLTFDEGPIALRMFPNPSVAQQLVPGSQIIVEVVGEGSARASFNTEVKEIGEPITAMQAESLVGDSALTALLVGDQPVVTPVTAFLDIEQVVEELEDQGFPINDSSGASSFLASSTFVIGSKHPIEYVFGSNS